MFYADKYNNRSHDEKHEGGAGSDDQKFAHEHSPVGISWRLGLEGLGSGGDFAMKLTC